MWVAILVYATDPSSAKTHNIFTIFCRSRDRLSIKGKIFLQKSREGVATTPPCTTAGL